MVQIIPDQTTSAGRIGRGFLEGLSQSIPQEIERTRLSQGLKQFEKESPGLSPMQSLARISTIPGITPQMIQSFSDLARQQARGQALPQGKQNQPSPFPAANPKNPPNASNIPSITQQTPLEKIQEGYIPPTQDQIIEEAGRRYNENPALYNNDPQKAIDAAESAAIREEKRNAAFQGQHENLSKIQDNVVSGLRHQSELLNVKVPANVYSQIEDRAIEATKPKSQGGRGLTEQQAKKEFGKELDEASRDYEKINSIGNWGITGRKASETLRNFKGLQEKFEKRNDTENMADRLIAESQLSPKTAYAIAEPVSRVPELSKAMKSLPALEKAETLFETKVDPQIAIPKTFEIAPRLAEIIKNDKTGKISPLAMAYELEKKGYDPETWLQYLTDHRKELNLKENQGRQLDTPNNLIGTLNDWWLESWSGLD